MAYTVSMSVVTTVWYSAAALMEAGVLIPVPLPPGECRPAYLVSKLCAALQQLGGDALLVILGVGILGASFF
jgi:hypothetical protein